MQRRVRYSTTPHGEKVVDVCEGLCCQLTVRSRSISVVVSKATDDGREAGRGETRAPFLFHARARNTPCAKTTLPLLMTLPIADAQQRRHERLDRTPSTRRLYLWNSSTRVIFHAGKVVARKSMQAGWGRLRAS
jgi:hypothetical protein